MTTFRPCSMMDDFVIIGELVFVFVSHVLLLYKLSPFLSRHSRDFLNLAFYSCLTPFTFLSSYHYQFILSILIPLFPSSFHVPLPSPTPLPLASTAATDGLWDVMTSQAAVDYVTDNLIRAGILPPRSEQSDDYTFQDRSTPTRGIFLFIIV